jgi:aerobic-type carbon monoxide dehydrogenase small subunit (CoxS/CutS family)
VNYLIKGIKCLNIIISAFNNKLNLLGHLSRFIPLLIISYMAKITLKVNGKKFDVDVDPSTPVLWVLRDHLNLIGTKFGCAVGSCGACTIHLNGRALRSCQLPVSAVGVQEITTIEGLSENGEHPVQKAWLEQDVAQCGYCQTGQIMTAAALLKSKPNPTDEDIDSYMSGNICRCGTYTRIRTAIKSAAKSTTK